MRELIDRETVYEFLLVVEPIGKDVGKSKRNEKDQR
jgi:hypothetical protein